MHHILPYPRRTAITGLLLACLLWIQLPVIAQQNNKVLNDSIYKKYAQSPGYHPGDTDPYYISLWKDGIPAKLEIIRKLDEHTVISELAPLVAMKDFPGLISFTIATNDWKLSPAAEKYFLIHEPSALQKFILAGTDINKLLNAIDYKGQMNLLSSDELSNAAVVWTRVEAIQDALSFHEVIFVDIPAEPHIETGIIGYNRSFHGMNTVDYKIPGANGKNIVVGVKEQKMETADLDLFKRVLPSSIAAPAITSHATVISSIIGGAGNSFYDGRGIAYGCQFFPSDFNNLFADNTAILNTNKVTVENHSYGTIVQQFYGAEAVSYDAQTWANRSWLHIFSAGNRGTAAATEGPYANLAGYANLTGNFKMAKNIISVAAMDNTGLIPAESSAGPLYDGRLAPQLTALGPNGTSDAAAMVSGTIAVMQQVFADSNSQSLPPASLVKAILYNTANDIYTKGIDYKTGYGSMNSYEAIRALQQKKYDGSSLVQGQSWSRSITVPSNAAQLKLTLSWTDSTAQVNNNKALVNDLDLEIVAPGGIIYKPWVLSVVPNRDSLAKIPIRKRDSLNTAEQVTIDLPVAGNYQVNVIGTTVITSAQPFHIAFNIDTLHTFSFTSPQHASDAIRTENPEMSIRWKTFVADTNETADLFISYNQGASWQAIRTAHKLYTSRYNWPIKDTSSTARLKMQTAFGDFFSSDFIIAPVTSVQLDFVCADSFRLSWNKHIYASSYKLYALVDSPYLKPLLNLTDTFVTLKRSVYPSLVYAVEPVLSNAIPAARSVGLNIELQGVKCFYKTLNYTLADLNKMTMILELSIASYVDSVYFEQVTAGGQLLRVYGSAKATNSLVYTQLVNDLPNGTIYIRGRIKLKSGAIVYTDIIPVLTSGQHKIVFYPNPVDRSTALHYVLQQGIASDSRLQIFDIYGRIVKHYPSLPQAIDLSALPRGIYLFKLLEQGGGVIDSGKLIVQ